MLAIVFGREPCLKIRGSSSSLPEIERSTTALDSDDAPRRRAGPARLAGPIDVDERSRGLPGLLARRRGRGVAKESVVFGYAVLMPEGMATSTRGLQWTGLRGVISPSIPKCHAAPPEPRERDIPDSFAGTQAGCA
jgi:hypothetical protein